MYTKQATVQVKNDSGKVVASRVYNKVEFAGMSDDDKGKPVGGAPDELLGDAIAYFQKEVGEKGNGVVELLRNVTYAYDLSQRSSIRQELVTGIAGPEKAIEKTLKDMAAVRAASGKPVTPEWLEKRRVELLAAANED